MKDTRLYLTNDSQTGDMKKIIPVEYHGHTYLFGIQETRDGLFGFYKGLKKSDEQTDKDKRFLMVDNHSKVPQEVIDSAIKKGVPSNITLPFMKTTKRH